jgi:hypothetical protein
MVGSSSIGFRESTRGIDSGYFGDISGSHVVESGHVPPAYRSNYQSVALQNDMDRVNDRSAGDRGLPERTQDMYFD